MIDVVVSGARGRMGSCVVQAVSEQDDMRVVGCFDPHVEEETVSSPAGEIFYSNDLEKLLKQTNPDVMVDFTRPDAVRANVSLALSNGVDVVLGTTGSTPEELQVIWEASAKGKHALFFAPNFTTGAVLMMRLAAIAAPYFDDVEIIEMHHDGKRDAPSGTAVQTARLIGAARDGRANLGPGPETEVAGMQGARGAESDGVRIHAVRGSGFMASQEVILSASGQNLTIRHDSTQRQSYMPGVLLAIRKVSELQPGVTVGLEHLMGLDRLS